MYNAMAKAVQAVRRMGLGAKETYLVCVDLKRMSYRVECDGVVVNLWLGESQT